MRPNRTRNSPAIMPSSRSRAKAAAAHPPTQLPPGLQDVSFDVRLTSEQFDSKGLLGYLSSIPGFSIRPDKNAARGAVRAGDRWKGLHAHVELARSRSMKEFTFQFEIVTVPHGRMSAGVPSIDELLSEMKLFFRNGDETYSGLVGAHFSLDLKKYHPTVPLPFTPPGKLDHVPGLPEISGLDFSFRERHRDQPLIRAFVTTYPSIHRMVIRLLMSHSSTIGDHLPLAMIDLAAVHLPIFAVVGDDLNAE